MFRRIADLINKNLLAPGTWPTRTGPLETSFAPLTILAKTEVAGAPRHHIVRISFPITKNARSRRLTVFAKTDVAGAADLTVSSRTSTYFVHLKSPSPMVVI
ncbi:hypothetical protein pipiens_000025, partial [Culex pipiens pipiens]